ncbi:MAG: PfkB family carbohydrate kinase [Candidatus Bipolaricaulia bacterium]
MFQYTNYLAVGHFTHDVTSHGMIIGGAAAYSAITARNLGASPRVVTSVGPDFNPHDPLLQEVEIHPILSASTTIFDNQYDVQGHRTQMLLGVATPLMAEHIPEDWQTADIVYLCPVVNEVDISVVTCLNGSLVGATPQGWMRRWDADGRVLPRWWEEAEAFLTHVDILVMSEEDIAAYPGELERYIALTPIVILTRGANGALLFAEGREIDSRAYPTQEIDPTGAGDVFATSFLLHYHRTGDPLAALDFAHCVASFSVEAEGTLGIPTYQRVLERQQWDLKLRAGQ